MKSISISLLAVILFSACSNSPKPTVVATEAVVQSDTASVESKTFLVDATASLVEWEGYEGIQLLNSEHNGSIGIKSGSLLVSGRELTGGSFVIDMNSIKVLDIPEDNKRNAKLTNHLKNGDFFDVAKFPSAAFDITSVAKTASDSLLITGNLTLKEITRSISFPASVYVGDSTVEASAKFYINRKDWNVLYRSEESLGDKMIRPEIGLKLDIKAVL